MSLFTFLLDYEGGTYISQLRADSENLAIAKWVRQDCPFRNPLDGSVVACWSDDVVHKIESGDRVVKIDDLESVWFISFEINNIPAFCNIVKTEE